MYCDTQTYRVWAREAAHWAEHPSRDEFPAALDVIEATEDDEEEELDVVEEELEKELELAGDEELEMPRIEDEGGIGSPRVLLVVSFVTLRSCVEVSAEHGPHC